MQTNETNKFNKEFYIENVFNKYCTLNYFFLLYFHSTLCLENSSKSDTQQFVTNFDFFSKSFKIFLNHSCLKILY